MQCPICGKDVEIQKKQVGVNEQGAPVFHEYAVCHDCKKQWNLNRQRMKKRNSAASNSEEKRTRATGENPAKEKRTNPSGSASQGTEPKRKAMPAGQKAAQGATPAQKKRMAERREASLQKETAGRKGSPSQREIMEGKVVSSGKGIAEGRAVPHGRNTAEEKAAEGPNSRVPGKAASGKESSGKEIVRVRPGSKDSAGRTPVSKPIPMEAGDKKEQRQVSSSQKKSMDGQKARRTVSPGSSDEKRELHKATVSGKAGSQKSIERKEDSRQESERIQRKTSVQRNVKNPAVEKQGSSESPAGLKKESAQKNNPAVEEQRYGNIPSEKVRAKKEQAVKQAYEEMLSTDSGQEKIKKKKRVMEEEVERERSAAKEKRASTKGYYEEAEEENEMEYEEPAARFRVIRIIFGILSLVAFGFFAYRGFFAGLDNIASASNSGTGTTYIVFALCMLISGLVLLILQNRNTIFAFVVPMAFYLGGAVFAFLKRGEDSLLLYSAIAGAVLGIVFLVLGVISGNQEEYDDYEDSDEDSDYDSRAEEDYAEEDYDDEYADEDYDDEDYDEYDDEE